MGGALIGLIALGLSVGVWVFKNPEGKAERSSVMLMLAWAGCAGVVWLCLRAGSPRPDAFTAVWRGFCLLPATMLAAFAIEQIGLRQIGYLRVLLGLSLTVLFLLLIPVEAGFGLIAGDRPLWPSILPVLRGLSRPETPWLLAWFWRLSLLLAVSAVAFLGFRRLLKHNDFRQRVFLDVALAFFVVLHGLIGFLGVRQATLNDRALANLRNEMVQEPGVARWTIVSPRRSPLVLRFVLTSIWPRIESRELDSWWDPELTRDLAEGEGPAGVHIIVDYNDRDTRTPTLRLRDNAGRSHIVEFTSVGTPQILWNHRLRLYRLNDRLIGR